MKYAFKMNKSAIAKTAGLALVAVLAVSSFVGLGQADTFYQLTVNVNDQCGPVVAKVTVVNGFDDGATNFTDSNGQTVFTLHAGEFYLHVSADGHTSQDTGNIVLNSDQNITVTLERTNGNDCGGGGGNTHQLAVNVKDACGPVVAKITVVNGFDDGATNFTDSNGQTVFTLHAGEFYLHVSADGHTSQDTGNIDLNSDQNFTVTLERTNGDCSTPPPPSCTTGTISVTSNLPSAAYYITRPNGTTFGWNGSHSFTDQAVGNYSINADDVPGYTKSVNPSSGNLAGCSTLSFTINYQLVSNPPPATPPAACTTGTINVVSNLATAAYFITRPNGTTFGWNGSHSFTDQAVGNYSINADDVPGYTKSVNPSSGNLAGCSTLSFTINYQPVVITTALPTPGTISLTKNVRDVTLGQTVFTSSTSANPGDQVEFQMQVKASNGAVNSIFLTDIVPNRLNYVFGSFTIDGVPSGNNLNNVGIGNLASGQTRTVVIRATVADSSQFSAGNTVLTNTANATSSSNSTSASASVAVSVSAPVPGSASLTITKNVRNLTQGGSFVKSISANPSDQVQFQIQVTASGSVSAQNVNVTDTLPSNFNLTSGQTTFNLGTMNPGSVQTVTLTGNVNQNNFCGTNIFTNTAQATSSNASTVSDTATINVIGNNCNQQFQSLNLSLIKQVRNLNTGSGFSSFTNASNGDQVQFQLVVTNNSGSNLIANNVRLTDNLPSGLSYIPGTFQVDNGTSFGNLFGGSQFVGSLAPGQSRIMTFNVTVHSSFNQTMVNQATASADNVGTVNAQASVSIFSPSVLGGNVNLVLSKRAFNQTQNIDATAVVAQPGNVIIYTLTAQNTGNSPATNFVVQDDLSDVLQLSMLQDFGNATFNLGNLSLTWPGQTIPAGGSVSQTFTVKVNSSFPAGSDHVMTNTYGNTVNVRVPGVLGAFVAPKTGASTAAIAWILAFVCTGLYFGVKKYRTSQA